MSLGIVRLVDPYQIASFSQFGEDRLIENMLSSIDCGHYVEVGCNSPIKGSNTWRLYQLGWSGLVIDANPDYIKQFKRLRVKDTAVSAVISDIEQEVDFYLCDEPLISGIGEKKDGNWQRSVENSRVIKTKTERLDVLIRRHLPDSDIHLLNVDVEGHELQVLKSLNLHEFAPYLIVVEMHDYDLSNQERSPVYLHLTRFHYFLRAYDGVNGYFVRSKA